MKKSVFILLMVVETFFAFVSMALLFNSLGAIIYLYTAIGFGIVLTPFFIRLKKTEDEMKKRKIRRIISMIMMLPILAAIVTVIVVVIALASMF